MFLVVCSHWLLLFLFPIELTVHVDSIFQQYIIVKCDLFVHTFVERLAVQRVFAEWLRRRTLDSIDVCCSKPLAYLNQFDRIIDQSSRSFALIVSSSDRLWTYEEGKSRKNEELQLVLKKEIKKNEYLEFVFAEKVAWSLTWLQSQHWFTGKVWVCWIIISLVSLLAAVPLVAFTIRNCQSWLVRHACNIGCHKAEPGLL